MHMIVGYELGTKRACSVRVSKTDRPDFGASIGVLDLDKTAETIRAENGRYLGWHVYRDSSSNGDLVFQCAPTDADRLSCVLEVIASGDHLLLPLLAGSYSEELKIDAIDHSMMIDPEDVERLKSWVSRLAADIEEAR